MGFGMKKATELEWLKYFYEHADFGPASDDVRDGLKESFIKNIKKELPDGYELYDEPDWNEDCG